MPFHQRPWVTSRAGVVIEQSGWRNSQLGGGEHDLLLGLLLVLVRAPSRSVGRLHSKSPRYIVEVTYVLAAVEIRVRIASEWIHAAIVGQRDAGGAERERRCRDNLLAQ